MADGNQVKEEVIEELLVLRKRVAEMEVSQLKRDLREAQLKESERRYRRIAETLTDHIYTVRIERERVVETRHGAGCLAVTGYTKEEFVADPYLWIRIVAEEDRGTVEDHARRILEKEEAAPLEHQIIRKDGSRRWVRNTPVLQRDDYGKLQGYDSLIQDISARKKTEGALRQREECYRRILGNMEEGYFEVDLAGNLTFFNDSLGKIIGVPKEKLLGMNNREYMDPETARRVYKIFKQVYESDQPGKVFLWEIERRNGKRIIEEGSVSLIRNAQDERIGFRGIVRDITERKKMEEALREREERFKQVAENADEWIWEVDATGLYTYSSPVIEKILGYTLEEVVGKKHFYDFFDASGKEAIKTRAFEVFKRREAIRKMENIKI